MAKQVGKKFVWVIKNFSSFQSEKIIYSDPVLIGDYKWCLYAYPKGNMIAGYFSLFLKVVDYTSLPSGWRIFVKFRVTIVPQPEKDLVQRESYRWFDYVSDRSRGVPCMIPLTKLHDKDGGFLVNGKLSIVAEVDVLEVIGILDASEKSMESSRPLKKIKLDNYAEASSVKENIVVNRFQVLSSQVESVKLIFERHPDIAVDFRAKSQHLRTTCMNFLLNLIETLCKSLEEISNDDLVDADIALTYLKDVSFKVDWLEKKLDQVKENKEKEQSAMAGLKETEENILKLKQKLTELDALAEEQKDVLSATRTPLSFDDVV